jgi:hypothetical protein
MMVSLKMMQLLHVLVYAHYCVINSVVNLNVTVTIVYLIKTFAEYIILIHRYTYIIIIQSEYINFILR